MKNVVILLLAVCIFFALPMSSQTIDSTVNDKSNTVKECNADLLSDLQVSKIQELYPKEFKHIMRYVEQSKTLVGKVNEKNHVSQNMRYADKAIKSYNNARKMYNELIKRKL